LDFAFYFLFYIVLFFIFLYLKKKLLKYYEMKKNFPNIYEDDSKSKFLFQSDNSKILKKKNDQESKKKNKI
jgi:hypothetical protein